MTGRRIAGKYVLEEQLGRGGFGTVHRAWHQDLEKHVALKVMNADLAHDEAAQRRFLREVEATTSFVHKYAVQLRDFGRDPETSALYYTMDLVPGPTLRRVLREGGPLEERRAVKLVSQVLETLEEAHAAGLVHRDLKPENLMATPTSRGEEVRVLDFGIAKAVSSSRDATSPLTLEGQTVGTLAYMSPEQADGQRLDGRSDLYSIAVVLFELLSARRPIEADPDAEDSVRQFLTRLLTRSPTDLAAIAPHVTPALAAVVMRCLAKDPAERLQSARGLRQALEAALPPDLAGDAPTPPPDAEGSAPTLPPMTRQELEAADAPTTPLPSDPVTIPPRPIEQLVAPETTPPTRGRGALVFAVLLLVALGLAVGLDAAGLRTRAGALLARGGGGAPPPRTEPPPSSEVPAPVSESPRVVDSPRLGDAPPRATEARAAETVVLPLLVVIDEPADGTVVSDETVVRGRVVGASGPVELRVGPFLVPVIDGAFERAVRFPMGVHDLKVVARAGQREGGARLTVMSVAAPAPGPATDPHEPNDSGPQASALPLGVSRRLFLEAGGEDWFRLEVPANHEVQVAIAFTHAAGDVELELCDARGDAIVSSCGSTDAEVVRHRPRRPGRYLVRVHGASNAYALVAAIAARPPADRFEPNEVAQDAAPLAPGDHAQLVCTGEDWYRVDAPPGHEVDASIGFDPRAADLDLALWAAEPTDELADSRGADQAEERARAVVPEGGLLVRVFNGTAPYRLQVVVNAPPPPDALEPNDDPERAPILGPGARDGLVTEGPDWFRLKVPAGHVARLTVAYPPGHDLLAALTHDGAVLRTSHTRSGEEVLTFASRAGLSLQALVQGAGFVPYSVRVELERHHAPADDPLEPNDLPQDATPLAAGAHGPVPCEGEDWYAVNLVAGARLSFTAEFSHADGDIDVVLVDPEGSEVAQSRGTADREAVEHVATAGGLHRVRVFTARPNVYRLAVAVTPPALRLGKQPR